MKKVSGLLSSLILLVLVFGLALSGCDAPEAGNEPAIAAKNAVIPSETAVEASEQKEIRFYSWETAFKANNEEVVRAFHQKNPDIKVSVEYLGDMNNTEYLKKIELMLLSGESVDVVMQPAFGEHIQMAASDALEPLDEYIKKEGINYTDVYTFSPLFDGKYYGFPGDVKSYIVLINKKHLEEANLPVPPLDWTWEDYREYAKRLTKGEGKDKRYGSYFHSWDIYNYLAFWTDRDDNPFIKKDGSLNFDDPLFREFMNFRYEMENVDKCQVPYMDVKSLNMNYRTMFFNEKVSMLPTGTWMIAELRDVEKYTHDFVTTFAPLPRWSKDTPAGKTNTESMYYAIARISRNKEEAYRFIRFYTTTGMTIKGASLTAERGGDRMKILEKIMGEDPHKYYDVDALKKVMTNPGWVDNVYTIQPVYHQQLRTLFAEESEKFLVGGISLDEAMDNIAKRAAELVEKNK